MTPFIAIANYILSHLLKHIKKNPNTSWSPKGELILNEKIISKTRMVDLINDLLRKLPSKPNGWKQLADVLKEIPRELIGNPDYIASRSCLTQKRRRHSKKLTWVPY